jgi:hypothetical protein
MAVENKKSAAITNRDATPRVACAAHLVRGPVFVATGTVEVAAADDDASVFRLFRVRSSDKLLNIFIANDAITGMTDCDVGIYQTAERGGAVVTKDVFADGVTFASALDYRDLLNNDDAADIAEVDKLVWERLGLTSDPQLEYDVCITANTIGSGAGTLAGKLFYTGGY